MSSIIENTIYLGTRGESFKTLIAGLLKRGNLAPKYIDMLTNEDSMKLYSQGFTSSSANPTHNYEIFEQMGDVLIGTTIINYSYRRFPQLFCPSGLKVVARLKINLGAKEELSKYGEMLGFWDYISASNEERSRNKKSLLEDAFESFCGVTGYILDEGVRNGVGYPIVYDILTSIFDEMDISLKYEDLYDNITRLKETFDVNPTLGYVDYIIENNEDRNTPTIAKAAIFQGGSKKKKSARKLIRIIGTGSAFAQDDAKQKAAAMGIETMKREGIFKPPPPEYRFFCQ